MCTIYRLHNIIMCVAMFVFVEQQRLQCRNELSDSSSSNERKDGRDVVVDPSLLRNASSPKVCLCVAVSDTQFDQDGDSESKRARCTI